MEKILNSETSVNLLLVENSADEQPGIEKMIASLDIHFDVCANINERPSLIHRNSYNVLLLCSERSNSRILSTLRKVISSNHSIAVIIVSDNSDPEFAQQLINAGCQDYLIRGQFEAESLWRSISCSYYRKQAESRLYHSEKSMISLINGAVDAILVIDHFSSIKYANHAAALIFEKPVKLLLGQDIFSLFDHLTIEKLLQCSGIFKLEGNNRYRKNIKDEGIAIINLEKKVPIRFTATHLQEEKDFSFSLDIKNISFEKKSEISKKQAFHVKEGVNSIIEIGRVNLLLVEKLELVLKVINTIPLINDSINSSSAIVLKNLGKFQKNVCLNLELDEFELFKPIDEGKFQSVHSVFEYYIDSKNQRFWLTIGDKNQNCLGHLILPNVSNSDYFQNSEQNIYLVLKTIASLIEDHQQGDKIVQLTRAVEQSPSGVFITDPEGYIQFVNQSLCKMTGYSEQELIGNTPSLFKSGLTSQSLYHYLWKSIKQGKIWTGEIQNKNKKGETNWENLIISPIRDAAGNVANYVAIKENIELRKNTEKQLIKMATHDPLTQLPNRLLLLDRLKQALALCRRQSTGVTVMMLDLDEFKLINDQHGHLVGDDLLKEVSIRLKSNIRESDTVGRQGGDEFIIILPELSVEDSVKEFVTNLIDKMAEPYYLNDIVIKVTCSIGIAVSHDAKDKSEDLYRKADISMYQAKNKGGHTSCTFNNKMEYQLNDRIKKISELQEAIEKKQFQLYFQPQISTKKGSMVGVEALIRWIHPEKGIIPPDNFISLAEESDNIVRIGDWVIEEACRQMREWRDAGVQYPRVAINLSAKQFVDSNLAKQIFAALEKYEIPANDLEVELTESQIMEAPDNAIKILNSLREGGVRVAGDDFGTGHSSLSYIKRLPLDRLKIDRSFITDITSQPNSNAIASMIINLGHTLGLTVLAEGVEHVDQLSLLHRLGCDEFQGYYCSKPIPAKEFAHLCETEGSLIDTEYIPKDERVLLVVDDETSVLKSIRRLLRKESYKTLLTDSPDEAFQLLAENKVNVILCDQRIAKGYRNRISGKSKRNVSGYCANYFVWVCRSGYSCEFDKPWCCF